MPNSIITVTKQHTGRSILTAFLLCAVAAPAIADHPSSTPTALPPLSFEIAQMVVRSFDHDSPASVQSLVDLVNQQRWPEAYAEGERLRSEFEGEPLFDLYYGRAAFAVGEIDKGLFAFERVNLVEPRNAEARLWRTRGYLRKGNTALARRQLTLLENYSLTAAQSQRRQRLFTELLALEAAQRTTSRFVVFAEAQYHTNINVGTHYNSIDLPDGSVFEPSEEFQAAPAPALALQAAYQRQEQRTQRLSRSTQVGITSRLSTFDDANNVGGVLAASWQRRNGLRYGAQILPYLNTESFGLNAVLSGGRADLLGPIAADAALVLGFGESNSYRVQGSLSSEVKTGGITTFAAASSHFALSDDFSPSSAGVGMTLAPRMMLGRTIQIQGLAGAQVQFDLQENEVFGTTQQAVLLNSQISVARALGRQGTISSRLRAFSNLSNQDLNDYQGLEIAVGYQHQW
ncbi:hypothetical protein NFC81_06445 [Salinispirillum sp. LH 10-3-1]|uniref:DUF560 domain-containing protein n=1 Tax=Salinispirillum sp. LH 10-3-1 TaxID=2952525 RepID=A0AB38YJY4_9GAMM